jgi:hypothetical protein
MQNSAPTGDVEKDGGWHEGLPRTMVDEVIVSPL